MKSAGTVLLAILLSVAESSGVLAASASGSPALALAALVARHSPDLAPAHKADIATLFAADAGQAAASKISVSADKIMCRTSNVDLTSRSCELAFKGGKHSLRGREANELFATMALVGIAPEGAAGSNIAAASKLNCTLDVAAIRQKDGGGASCSFDAGS